MSKRLSPKEKALGAMAEFYQSLGEHQLAFYHRVPRDRIADWKEGKRSAPGAKEAIRHVVHIGALGSGKSVAQRFAEIAISCGIPDNYGVIVRKRWEELQNHVIDDLYRLADEITEGHRKALMSDPKRVGASFEITVYTVGRPSRIIIKPEPDSPSEQVLADHWKGPEYGWFSLEEATQLQQITYDTLSGRLRRRFRALPSGQDAYMWAGMVVTNPPYAGHWIHRIAEDSEAKEARQELQVEDTLVIRSSMMDNKFLPSGYIEATKRKYENDPIKFGMLIEGKDGIHIDGKPVFGSYFRSDIHCDRKLRYNPFAPLVVGVDFGFRRPAAVFLQEDSQNNFNVIGELLPEGIDAETFADKIWEYIYKNFPKLEAGCVFFGDHAGTQQTDKGDTTVLRFAKRGINVYTKPLGKIESSLDSIRLLLSKMVAGRPRLVVNPTSCPVLVQAFVGGYHYKETRGQRDPEPNKTHENHFDDVMDALRYAICNVTDVDASSLVSSYGIKYNDKQMFAKGPGHSGRITID